MAALPGMRGTGDFTTDFRPTNYRELYTFLEPNGDAPMNAILSMLPSESTDDPKYNNFRDEMPTRVISFDTGGTGTTLTAVTAADVGWLNRGTLLVVASTGELIRCTADGNTGAGTVTVTRAVGGGATTNILTATDLFVAGHAAEEGDVTPTSITFDPTVEFNYTQIFKEPFKITGTVRETFFRTGDKEDEYTTKALKLHMSDIERAMIFSKRSEGAGPSTGQRLRTTGGLINTLTTVTDAASAFAVANTITETEFDQYLIDTVFEFGSKTKVAFVGTAVAGHLLKFGKARWTPQAYDSGTYGIRFTRYTTPAGDLLVHLHPQFRQLTHMAQSAIILDTDYLKYRFMRNRDTQLLDNRQGTNEDALVKEYMTECGLELTQDKVHVYLKNWTTAG